MAGPVESTWPAMRVLGRRLSVRAGMPNF